MRGVKLKNQQLKQILLFSIFALSMLFASAQYVQPMGYKDYTFWGQMNIGNNGAKTTNASAYLELGKASGSTKGFLLPRGSKTDVGSPATGLLFYDLGTNKVVVYNGSIWEPLGADTSSSSTSTLGYGLFYSNDAIAVDTFSMSTRAWTKHRIDSTLAALNIASYTAGYGLNLVGNSFKVDTSVIRTVAGANAYTNTAISSFAATLPNYSDSLNNYVQFSDTVWLKSYITTTQGTADSLTFNNGLSRLGNIVSANYYIPQWNANRIQGYYVDAGRPGNGYFLGFDSSNGIARWMKPDSVVGGGGITAETDAIALAALADSAADIRAAFPTYTTPTLQQVTTSGATTNHNISVSGSTASLYVYNPATSAQGVLSINSTSGHGTLSLSTSAGLQGQLAPDILTSNRILLLPDASDTLANRAWVRSLGVGGGITSETDPLSLHLTGTSTQTGKIILSGSLSGSGTSETTFFDYTPTLTATANNQTLTTLYVKPTIGSSGFTGVSSVAIRGITSGNGYGVYGETGTGKGVYGVATSSGNAVEGISNSNGTGIYGNSQSGYAANLQAYGTSAAVQIVQGASGIGTPIWLNKNNSSSTNTFIETILMQVGTTGTAAAGFGSKITSKAEAADGTAYTQGFIGAKWTTATAASRISQWEIWGVNNAAAEAKVIGFPAVIQDLADNAAALAAGLTAGDIYRTGDALKIVH
jgi:hypothetical protein